MVKQVFLSSLICFFWASTNGQVNNSIDNQSAINIYNEILSTRNPNVVIDLLNGVNIEQVAEDSLKSYFYYYKGSAHGQLSRFDSAIYFLDKASEALPVEQYPIIEIQILRAYGNVNWARNFYNIALNNYEKALNISYEVKDPEFQISLLGNIAGIYSKLENLPLALEYALKSEEISDKTGVIRPRSHMKIGNYLNGLGQYESALKSLDKTRKLIITEGRDSIALGVNYVNIATAHLFLENYSLAKNYLDTAEVILGKLGYQYQGLYLQKIEHALGTNNLSRTQQLIKEAEPIFARQQDQQEVKSLKLLAKELAVKQGKLNEAIRLQEEIYALNDSIKNDKMVNRVYELQTQYETARKEAEIENLTLANALKDEKLISSRNKQYAIGTGGVMSIFILVLFFSFTYKKQKAEREAQELQMEALKKRFMELHASPSELAVSLEFEELNSKLNTELTEREFECLKLSLEGKTNTEIADQLFISVSTVKFHLRNTYSKMGVGNRKEAFQLMLKTS
ncbi:MAG: LuxR C-terminal-related transcriptional regulator [Fulvivirga sp.]